MGDFHAREWILLEAGAFVSATSPSPVPGQEGATLPGLTEVFGAEHGRTLAVLTRNAAELARLRRAGEFTSSRSRDRP